MIPKGIFGVCSSTVLDLRETIRSIRHALIDEEEFDFISSPDEKCLLGVTRSTLTPYPYALSSDRNRMSIGVRDGCFFSPSPLGEKPHLAVAPEFNCSPCINGMFQCAAYCEGELVLLSDPWGSLPMYYHVDPRRIVVSSSIQLILTMMDTSDIRYSESGLAQFLCFNTVFDGETPFINVRRLRSTTLMRFDLRSRRISSHRYWTPCVFDGDPKISLRNTVEAFHAAVDRSLRAAPTPVSAALTGGYDTRTIWSVLLQRIPRLRAVTHGMIRGIDVELAEKIAAQFAIEHDVHWIDRTFEDRAPEYLRELVQTTNGFASAEYTHAPFVYRRHLGRSNSILDGNHTHLEGRWSLRNCASSITSKDEFFEAFWKQLFDPALMDCCVPGERSRIIETARNSLCNLVFDPASYESVGIAADVFTIEHLLGCQKTDLALLQNHYNRYLSPYFDLDYVNALSTVPASMRWRQLPQYEIIRRYSPRLARLPRCYSDVRTLGTANPYLLRVPVAWHRFGIPLLQKLLPSSILSALDPYRPSVEYSSLFQKGIFATDVGEFKMPAVIEFRSVNMDGLSSASANPHQSINAALRLIAIAHPSSIFHYRSQR